MTQTCFKLICTLTALSTRTANIKNSRHYYQMLHMISFKEQICIVCVISCCYFVKLTEKKQLRTIIHSIWSWSSDIDNLSSHSPFCLLILLYAYGHWTVWSFYYFCALWLIYTIVVEMTCKHFYRAVCVTVYINEFKRHSLIFLQNEFHVSWAHSCEYMMPANCLCYEMYRES